jgi:hypothetical protein
VSVWPTQKLYRGNSHSLNLPAALAGTSYTWNVPAIVPDLDYMFLLEDSQSSIYAGPFQILGVNFTSASTTSVSLLLYLSTIFIIARNNELPTKRRSIVDIQIDFLVEHIFELIFYSHSFECITSTEILSQYRSKGWHWDRC